MSGGDVVNLSRRRRRAAARERLAEGGADLRALAVAAVLLDRIEQLRRDGNTDRATARELRRLVVWAAAEADRLVRESSSE